MKRDLKNANNIAAGIGTMIDDAIEEEDGDTSGTASEFVYDPMDEVWPLYLIGLVLRGRVI